MAPTLTMLSSPIDITPAVQAQWQDVDIDSYISNLPSGISGVIFAAVNSSTTNSYTVDFRKNGSTDSFDDNLDYNSSGNGYKSTKFCGVDSSNIFEVLVQNITYVKLYLIGYFGDGVTFFTNRVDKSTATTLSWTDVDCSTNAPGAVGLIFRPYLTSTTNRNFGLRKNGSSDNRTHTISAYGENDAIIGCDGSRICEQYISAMTVDLYLSGYITSSDAIFNTNATDLSMTSTAGWEDLSSALAAGAMAGLFEIIDTRASYHIYGLRKNGSSDTWYYKTFVRHAWEITECDSSGIIEGRISDGATDFFLLGYFKAAATIMPLLMGGYRRRII